MSKISGPLFSFGAAGSVGKEVIFQGGASGQIARKTFSPGVPASPAQAARRSLYGQGCALWNSSDFNALDVVAGEYSAALHSPRSNHYNDFMRQALNISTVGGTPCAVTGWGADVTAYNPSVWNLATQTTAGTAIQTMCSLGGGVVLASSPIGGHLYRSTDYGHSYTKITSTWGTVCVYRILNLGGGVVLFGGFAMSKIYRSTDYGLTFTAVYNIVGSNGVAGGCTGLAGVAVFGGYTDSHIYRTFDYGLTWENILPTTVQAVITGMCWCGGTVFLFGTNPDGQLYKSVNTCASYTLLQDFTQVVSVIPIAKLEGTRAVSGGITSDSLYSSTNLFTTYSRRALGLSIDGVYCFLYISNELMLIGTSPGGLLLRSTDNNVTYDNLGRVGNLTVIRALRDAGNNNLVAGGTGNQAPYYSPALVLGRGFWLPDPALSVDFLGGLTATATNLRAQCVYDTASGKYFIPAATFTPGSTYYGRIVSRVGNNQIISGLYCFKAA